MGAQSRTEYTPGLQSVLVELVVQGFDTDPESYGGTSLIAASEFDGSQDKFLFDGFPF